MSVPLSLNDCAFRKKGCYVKGKKRGFGTYVGKGDKWSLCGGMGEGSDARVW